MSTNISSLQVIAVFASIKKGGTSLARSFTSCLFFVFFSPGKFSAVFLMCMILQEKCRHFTKCNDRNLFVCARKSLGFVMPPFLPQMFSNWQQYTFFKNHFFDSNLFVFMFVEFITRFECLTCYKIEHQTEIKWSENCFKLILKNKSEVHRKREKKQPQFCLVT